MRASLREPALPDITDCLTTGCCITVSPTLPIILADSCPNAAEQNYICAAETKVISILWPAPPHQFDQFYHLHFYYDRVYSRSDLDGSGLSRGEGDFPHVWSWIICTGNHYDCLHRYCSTMCKHNSRAVLPELSAVCTECACNSFHRFLDPVLARRSSVPRNGFEWAIPIRSLSQTSC
ncbi:uncharacterized protein LOC132833723 isoform X2 [Hemiscyllium ocellatum]|uniref:uncharacterized protein LOC132833723 isoform X2 n=1 Tax=Hemiscyllium ocellatum TaxID=170820 RepID=UPI0029669439|nr:uncharacterized protein LOC132833723 isoform X2 [Hemiscyllium ocellatum]